MCLGDPNCSCNKISDVRAIRDQELVFSNAYARLVPDDERTKKRERNSPPFPMISTVSLRWETHSLFR